MKSLTIAAMLVASALTLSGVSLLDQPSTAKPTLTTAPLAKSADLKAFEFLAGQWSASDESGFTEEHWSKPHGTSIMGMFRWCKPGGEPSMFEILSITAETDGVFLRLRHFSPKLAAKEDKDAPMTMKLESVANRKAVFKAHANAGMLWEITYECPTPDRLLIDVVFTPDSKREPLKFDLKRQSTANEGKSPD